MIVYKHTRNDTNEIFYVGIGIDDRPYRISGRNKHWHNIAKSVGYEVEIIAEGLSADEACNMEIELIKKHGRRDLGTGPLVNLTPGGEYYSHWEGKKLSYDTRKKMSISRKKYISKHGPTKMTKDIRKKISDTLTGTKMSKESSILKSINGKGKGTKKIFQYNFDNKLIREWESATKASSVLGISRTAILNAIRRNHSSGGFIWKRIKK